MQAAAWHDSLRPRPSDSTDGRDDTEMMVALIKFQNWFYYLPLNNITDDKYEHYTNVA